MSKLKFLLIITVVFFCANFFILPVAKAEEAKPVISDVKVDITSRKSARGINDIVDVSDVAISWKTDLPSNSYVEYSTNFEHGGGMKEDEKYVTEHIINITGLPMATLYYYKLSSQVANGSPVESDVKNFTTGSADVTLVIYEDNTYARMITNRQYNTADANKDIYGVYWATNKEANCNIAYGETQNLVNTSGEGNEFSELVNTPASTSDGKNFYNKDISASDEKYFKIVCIDNSGITKESEVHSLSEETVAVDKPDLIVDNISVIPKEEDSTGNNQIIVTIKNNSNIESSILNSGVKLIYGTNFDEINNCAVGNCNGVGDSYNAAISASWLGKQSLSPGETYKIVFNRGNYLFDVIEFDKGVKYLIKAIVDNDKEIAESNENNNTLTKTVTINDPQDSTECVDSDNGKNYYVKGFVTGNGGLIKYDSCVSNQNPNGPSMLIDEYYCNEDYEIYHYIGVCPTGTSCEDGACIKIDKPDLTVTSIKLGDGTYELNEGDKVQLDNGLIIVPVYFSSGSGSTAFFNVKFDVYSSATKLATTDFTRVAWDTKTFNISQPFYFNYKMNHVFKVYVESLGQMAGVWNSRITFKSEDSSRIKSSEVDTQAVDTQISEITTNANLLSNNKMDNILAELKQLRDIVKEQAAKIKYLDKLTIDMQALSVKVESAINNFITYGVDANTQKLGEGERAAVMYSYKSAFNKLPETEEELADAIKIANGRWPSMTNDEAEKKAKAQFQKIYQKVADMNNANDNAAVTVMAYGLRQKAENRNLESEKNGIKIFKGIYGHTPNSTEEWNIMQAITYSGSARGVDSDGDLLTDEREVELGTDPNNRDTDGDGYIDGVEVANGYDPLKK